MAKQEHEFGDGGLDRAVITAGDPGFEELASVFVAFHVDRARRALGDVDDDQAALRCIAYGLDKPFPLRGVARAEGFHHDGFQPFHFQHLGDDAFLYAREEGEHDDVGIVEEVRFEGLLGCRGRQYAAGIEIDVHAHVGQIGVVVGAEGVEVLGIDFGGAVASQQLVLEQDAHLGHHGAAVGAFGHGDFDGRDEVFLAVGAQHADGELAAGEDDRLGEIFEGETHGRGRVGHRVGAMQHHETVEEVVVVVDDARQLDPQLRIHVGRVDGRIELHRGDVALYLFQLGNVLHEVVECEALQCSGFGVAYHADGATGVDEQD